MPASSVTGVPRPGTPPVGLTALAASVAGARTVGAEVAVAGITAATDFVRPGDLFAGVPGRTAHGAAFAERAVAAGAVAVLTDDAGAALLPPDLPALLVPDVRAALGPVSAAVYDRPADALAMLGVTGTSGKTTTTFLLRAGLLAAGVVPGLIGTVATMIGDDVIDTGFTTPEAPELHALLAVMRERGVRAVAMEVSSHAVAMHRTGGIEFGLGGFTNLSEDHLDFHRDMEDYFAAKMRFVTATRQAVVVVDDEWGHRAARLRPDALTVSTDGGAAAVRALDVRENADGTTTFDADGPWGTQPLGCAIPGRYNVANVTLAWTMLTLHGTAGPEVAAALAAAQVPGRMERIDAGQPFLAVVDYSHKPAAVDGALRALRALTTGRLTVVLGCGGDRDRGKRPHMGEIAARGADRLIVTDDNPRSEDPATIRRAMLDGALAVPASERGAVEEIGDRAEAIRAAVADAGAGDTVLVAGKGHERGQEIAGVKYPFDDRAVLREALVARAGRP